MKPTNPEGFKEVLAWLDAGAPHVSIPGDGTIDGFWMGSWSTYYGPGDVERIRESYDIEIPCGTVCCIAGAVRQFQFKNDWAPIYNYGGTATTVQDFLGMSFEDAFELFEPGGLHFINDPRRAARVIRHYIETGIVDWSIQ